MLKCAAVIVAVLALSATLDGQTTTSPVKFAWDASLGATGYLLAIDGGPQTDLGLLLVSPPYPLSVGPHAVSVWAYNASGESPAALLPFVVGQVVDPACTPPLGNRVVAIFPTTLQKTGSGGALSRARLDFQLSSPNSPVVHVAVRTLGADLVVLDGANLGALAGVWFTVPATSGTYPLSVRASNVYGCVNEVQANKTVTVP